MHDRLQDVLRPLKAYLSSHGRSSQNGSRIRSSCNTTTFPVRPSYSFKSPGVDDKAAGENPAVVANVELDSWAGGRAESAPDDSGGARKSTEPLRYI